MEAVGSLGSQSQGSQSIATCRSVGWLLAGWCIQMLLLVFHCE